MTDDERADYRRHLYDALHSASRDYDQAILALSAGTLALSVTFVGQVAPITDATRPLLLVGWGVLLVAIVTIVASLQTSQAVIRQYLDHVGEDPPWQPGGLATATTVLSLAAGGCLVIGLAMLGWYALASG